MEKYVTFFSSQQYFMLDILFFFLDISTNTRYLRTQVTMRGGEKSIRSARFQNNGHLFFFTPFHKTKSPIKAYNNKNITKVLLKNRSFTTRCIITVDYADVSAQSKKIGGIIVYYYYRKTNNNNSGHILCTRCA